jgi:hypothetical protein
VEALQQEMQSLQAQLKASETSLARQQAQIGGQENIIKELQTALNAYIVERGSRGTYA